MGLRGKKGTVRAGKYRRYGRVFSVVKSGSVVGRVVTAVIDPLAVTVLVNISQLFCCAHSYSIRGKAMSIEDNKEVVRRYYEEAFNEGRTDLLEELIAEDVVNHDPVSDETLTPEEARGFEGFVRHVEAAREAFPDATVTIEDVIAEGDEVLVRFTFEGTHEGRFVGIEPTGNRVEGTNMVLMRLEDGKIVERWEESDSLDLLRQLGVLPPPEELARTA